MTEYDYRFSKKERLCLKNEISLLFEKGRPLTVHPLRLRYILVNSDSDTKCKVLFSVPKKLFKRAVKRNLIRRKIREAYRLNKHLLTGSVPEGKHLLIAFVYLDNSPLAYKIIEDSVKKSLSMVEAAVRKKNIKYE